MITVLIKALEFDNTRLPVMLNESNAIFELQLNIYVIDAYCRKSCDYKWPNEIARIVSFIWS